MIKIFLLIFLSVVIVQGGPLAWNQVPEHLAGGRLISSVPQIETYVDDDENPRSYNPEENHQQYPPQNGGSFGLSFNSRLPQSPLINQETGNPPRFPSHNNPYQTESHFTVNTNREAPNLFDSIGKAAQTTMYENHHHFKNGLDSFAHAGAAGIKAGADLMKTGFAFGSSLPRFASKLINKNPESSGKFTFGGFSFL